MAMQAAEHKSKIWEDKWVHTACGGCYGGCAIKVHVVNGVAVAIEGVDTSLGARGGVCGKGAAGLMLLYDPNRLNYPLRRTNPQKGLGVDPRWKRITWDEALSEIADRLKKVLADNPEKVWSNSSTVAVYSGWGTACRDFVTAMGSHMRLSGGGSLHCGNAAHQVAGLVHGAWSSTADWRYANYVIKWGTNKGAGAGHSMTTNARLRGEMMARGAKEVSVDPMCNFSGGSATEWVPILPGTDTAVALAICNILVETGTLDLPFLKMKTNLPFLVKADGKFVRDPATKEPLVWDTRENKAKLHHDDSLGVDDPALEGKYVVDGVECQPSFVLLREHLKQYTPEAASEVSSVPVATIRKLAKEWTDNARIGSCITIDGKSYPYRPVASLFFRGTQGHTNAVHQVWALDLLNILVGAEDVPGGCVGWPCIREGHPDTGRPNWIPRIVNEGGMIPAMFMGGHDPWPIHEPSYPCKNGRCDEFWTQTTTSGAPNFSDREEVFKKLGMTANPEFMFIWGTNMAIGTANVWDQVEIMSKIPFIVHCDLFINETSEALADIMLPDVCYLERLDWQANLRYYFFNQAPTNEEWAYHPQFPVVEPIAERRNLLDVLCEIADRVGIRDTWNNVHNKLYLIDDPHYMIKPDEKLDWAGMGDKMLKWCFGDDKGLEWFREHRFITWPKKVEETYWRWHYPALEKMRIPVYREYLITTGEKAKEIGQRVGLELEYEQYTALPTYFPPISHREISEEFDLFAFSYRDTLHTNSTTLENPWLDEVSQMCPYTYTITINAETGRAKGLKDGDRVWLETPYGRKESGVLKLMEGQHPKSVGIAGQAGLWSDSRPIAKGKGSNFNKILPCDMKHFDPITLCIETAVAVKIYKMVWV